MQDRQGKPWIVGLTLAHLFISSNKYLCNLDSVVFFYACFSLFSRNQDGKKTALIVRQPVAVMQPEIKEGQGPLKGI